MKKSQRILSIQICLYYNILIIIQGPCAGIFYSHVIPIQKDGNCQFCAVSYCMYNIKDWRSEIKLNTANKIVNEWEYFKDFIKDLSVVNRAEEHKNLLSRDEKYGGNVELT